MKTLLIIVSVAGLGFTVVPSFLVFLQEITLATHKQLMLVGMLMWFSTAPFWIKEQDK